jgi:hypothetical protein
MAANDIAATTMGTMMMTAMQDAEKLVQLVDRPYQPRIGFQ